MTYVEIPASIDDLNVGMLNDLLMTSPKWEAGPFESIKIVIPHGALHGMSGAVHRIDGRLASGTERSLIVKLRDIGGSARAQQGGMHEVTFYRDLANIAGVDSPESYVAVYDDTTHRMILVLEHLEEEGSIGTIQTYLDTQQVERIVVALAGMHAKWWNSSELAALTQIRTFEEVMEAGGKLFASGHFSGKRFIEQYGEHIHPEIYRLYDSPVYSTTQLRDGFSSHRTLCNYDVAAKNLFLPADPTVAPKFFDWSLLIRGSIGIELAVVLAYSLHVDEHHRIAGILDTYLDAMHRLGVGDLTRETLWNDFRYGLLVRLAAPIALTTRDYPPAHDLALELLPRITSAVLETDALELLE
jgi:hypothetical protein